MDAERMENPYFLAGRLSLGGQQARERLLRRAADMRRDAEGAGVSEAPSPTPEAVKPAPGRFPALRPAQSVGAPTSPRVLPLPVLIPTEPAPGRFPALRPATVRGDARLGVFPAPIPIPTERGTLPERMREAAERAGQVLGVGQVLGRRIGDTAGKLLRRRGAEAQGADIPTESEEHETDQVETLSGDIALHRRALVDIEEREEAPRLAAQQRIAKLKGEQQRVERALARASEMKAAPEVQARILQESTDIAVELEAHEGTVNDFAKKKKDLADDIARITGERDRLVAGLPVLDRRQSEALVRQVKGRIKRANAELGAIMQKQKQARARADGVRPGRDYESQSEEYKETLRWLGEQKQAAKLGLLLAEEYERVAMQRAERAVTGRTVHAAPPEAIPAEAGPPMTEEEARGLFIRLPSLIKDINSNNAHWPESNRLTRKEAYDFLMEDLAIPGDTPEKRRREFHRRYLQARRLVPDAEIQMNEMLVRAGLADLWLDWRKDEEGLALWHDPATLPGAAPSVPAQPAPEAVPTGAARPLPQERVDVLPTIAIRPGEADGTLEQQREKYPDIHLIFDIFDISFGRAFNHLDNPAVWAHLKTLDPNLTREAVYDTFWHYLRQMPDETKDGYQSFIDARLNG